MKLLFDQNVSPDLVRRLSDLSPDSNHVSMLHGFPPKLLWLRTGNCRADDVEELIRSNQPVIAQLDTDNERGILVLFGKGAS